MFGWKRFINDCKAFYGMSNLTEEESLKRAENIIWRFGRTNYLAGCLTVTAGVVTGMIAIDAVKEIKEKKKCKKLEDANK